MTTSTARAVAAAARPGSGGAVVPGRRWRDSPRLRAGATVGAAMLLAAVLALPWAVFRAGVGGDLAAQWAWADFAAKHPGSAYDLSWYGGIHPASYSLVVPYLMAGIGVRTTAVLSGVLSAGFLALVVVRCRALRWVLPVALWGAVCVVGDLAAGRITFEVGDTFGLAALALAQGEAVRRRGAAAEPAPSNGVRLLCWSRIGAVALLSALSTLASPLAGLFVDVVAFGLLCSGRRRTAWAMAVPPPVLVVATTVLFPSAGVDPYSLPTILVTFLCGLAVALLAPRDWIVVRAGAWAYAVGTLLTAAVSSPIGANIQRLGLQFGSVVLLAVFCAERGGRWSLGRNRAGDAPAADGGDAVTAAVAVPFSSLRGMRSLRVLLGIRGARRLLRVRGVRRALRSAAFGEGEHVRGWGLRGTALLAACFLGVSGWMLNADLIRTPGPSSATLARPLLGELDRLDADRGRVEAVPMFNHWESWGLAPTVELARGWNRQLDAQRDPLFYDGTLTPATYHAWLRTWGVDYVVLPTGPLDPAGRDEAQLIKDGQPWLRPVWHNHDWKLYAVTDPLPLAQPPATVSEAGSAEVVVRVPQQAGGSTELRIPWSPWLTVTGPGTPCLAQNGDWTSLHTQTPGTYHIGTEYSLPRGTACPH